MPTKVERPFEQVLQDLADEKNPPAIDDLEALSDLTGANLDSFKKLWGQLSAERRLTVMTMLGELAENDYVLDLVAVARVGLTDSHASVRAASLRNLSDEETLELLPLFSKLFTNDPSPEVREAAAQALGTFMYLGALEDLEAAATTHLENLLLATINGDDVLEVRRRALESVGYSSRPEVTAAIRVAYHAPEEPFRLSALVAMGRTLDHQWSAIVQHELRNTNPRFRYEAARAAGELQLSDSVQALSELTRDDDEEVQEAAIWALGEIGTEEARETLNALRQHAKGARAELLDEVIANADVMADVANFDLFDLADYDEDDPKHRLN